MAVAVDLCVPELSSGDAVTRHTLLLRDLLASRGISVNIVVERRVLPDADVVLAKEWSRRSNTVIFQHAIGSQLAQKAIDRQRPIILNYHNITPARFIEGWDPALSEGLKWGRDQLRQLMPLTTRAIAVSDYNARELRNVGFEDVVVCPILCRFETRCTGKAAALDAVWKYENETIVCWSNCTQQVS